jgi:hypothetical protein
MKVLRHTRVFAAPRVSGRRSRLASHRLFRPLRQAGMISSRLARLSRSLRTAACTSGPPGLRIGPRPVRRRPAPLRSGIFPIIFSHNYATHQGFGLQPTPVEHPKKIIVCCEVDAFVFIIMTAVIIPRTYCPTYCRICM